MKDLLLFLIQKKYSCQLKGKSWLCSIDLVDEKNDRIFRLSWEVVFTPEMVASIKILPNHTAEIELIH